MMLPLKLRLTLWYVVMFALIVGVWSVFASAVSSSPPTGTGTRSSRRSIPTFAAVALISPTGRKARRATNQPTPPAAMRASGPVSSITRISLRTDASTFSVEVPTEISLADFGASTTSTRKR